MLITGERSLTLMMSAMAIFQQLSMGIANWTTAEYAAV
jgi:hypothetical protein